MNISKITSAISNNLKKTAQIDNGKECCGGTKRIAFKASQPLKLDTFKKAGK